MVRISNNILTILNTISFILSIPIVVVGVWLSRQGATECEHYLEKVFLATGIFLMIISLAGMIGACCRVSWLLWLYLFVMLGLIVLLVFSTVFTLVVINKGGGQSLSGKAYKEYRLEDYSVWLQKRVNNNDENWRRIKSCLQYSKVCERMGTDEASSGRADDLFYSKRLSAIQSGCCKPSDSCNFTYVSPTYWNKTTKALPNTDCVLWDNDPNVLCFNCESCKAGFLDNLKNRWKRVAVSNVVYLVCLIIVYSIGCCALRTINVTTPGGSDTFKLSRFNNYFDKISLFLS